VLAEYGNYLKSYHAKTNFVLNTGAKSKPEGRQIIAHARQAGRQSLLENEAKQLFRLHGGPVAEAHLAATVDEAVSIAAKIDGPVAMKIVSPHILHKSDAGGVMINVKGKSQVRQSFSKLVANARRFNATADIRGVLVEPMAVPGLEIIIGTKIDEQFGPVIMYGLGGIMVEILKDVSFRVLPISRFTAKTMIDDTKSAPLLRGVRGTAPYDQKALINLLLLVSDMVEAYPDIEEMDLNPIILHEKGATIVDARILLKGE
jgi:acetyltransferase